MDANYSVAYQVHSVASGPLQAGVISAAAETSPYFVLDVALDAVGNYTVAAWPQSIFSEDAASVSSDGDSQTEWTSVPSYASFCRFVHDPDFEVC